MLWSEWHEFNYVPRELSLRVYPCKSIRDQPIYRWLNEESSCNLVGLTIGLTRRHDSELTSWWSPLNSTERHCQPVLEAFANFAINGYGFCQHSMVKNNNVYSFSAISSRDREKFVNTRRTFVTRDIDQPAFVSRKHLPYVRPWNLMNILFTFFSAVFKECYRYQ